MSDDELAQLKKRVAELEATKTPPKPVRDNSGALVLAGVGLILAVLGYVMFGGSLGEAFAPMTARVTYQLSGTARAASITIQNASGGTEQMDVRIPWDRSFDAVQGQFVYISAQNDDPNGGTLSCVIKVDGVTWKQAASIGWHNIASCDGAVGRE